MNDEKRNNGKWTNALTDVRETVSVEGNYSRNRNAET